MIGRRVGRPGLIGTMARTAVISGTATAVSGNVQRRQMRRAAGQQAQPQYAAQPAQAAPPAAGAADPSERINQLRELAELKAQGVLTEAEFAAEKARILQG